MKSKRIGMISSAEMPASHSPVSRGAATGNLYGKRMEFANEAMPSELTAWKKLEDWIAGPG
jgi:hypothetical protein